MGCVVLRVLTGSACAVAAQLNTVSPAVSDLQAKVHNYRETQREEENQALWQCKEEQRRKVWEAKANTAL